MKTLLINSAFIFSVLFFACKSKQATANSKENNSTVNSADANAPKTYRFIVSFISIGTGVDGDAFNKLEKFIKEHPKKPAFEQKRWGREGEVDFMFSLKEFKTMKSRFFFSSFLIALATSLSVSSAKPTKICPAFFF